MVGAAGVRLEDAVAVAVETRPPLAAPHAARRPGAAHHSAGAVHGREERLLVLGRLDALEDHGLVAHRAADEALLTRPGRRAALADDPVGAAEVLLPPREVVVVVHLVHRLGAEDLEHLRDHDVAAGVRVLAGELHRGDVGVAELAADLEEHRRRVHLALVRAAVEREALREREEARGGLVAEAARAEVHAHPDPAVLVLHHVHVVVARADRAELRPGELRELPLRREVGVADPVEDRMVGPLGRRHAHAERDPAGDLAHHRLDAAERVEVGPRQLGARGLVAAADVVADARRRDVPLVRDAAADRLAVARVVIRAQHAELRVAGRHAALELREAPRVHVAERLDRAHRSSSLIVEGPGFEARRSSTELRRRRASADGGSRTLTGRPAGF